MASSLDTSLDLKQYARMLWRRRGIALVATVSVLAATLITLSIVPREYSSEAMLMIEERTPLSRDVEQLMGGNQRVAGYGAEEARLSKLVGRVRSRPFLERVIRILRMQEDPKVIAEAESRRKNHPEVSTEEIAIRILVKNLQSRIEFRSAGTGIYGIRVVDYSPQNAQLIAKWISENFVDVILQGELEKIRSARDFGAEQLNLYEDRLRRSEGALEQYKGSMIQQSLAPNALRPEKLVLAEALLRRLREQAEVAQAGVKPFAREAERAGLDARDASLWSDAETSTHVQRLRATLQGAIVERLAVETPAESSPWPPQGTYDLVRRDLLQHLDQRAASLHPGAGTEATEALARAAFSRLDSDIQNEASQTLDQAIQDSRRQARSQPVDELELSRLASEVQNDRQLLESFRAQMIAGDVSQAVETTKLGLRVEILDPAQLPLSPSRPNRKKILLAALLMGPLLGAGLAFLAETTDVTLRSIDDFRRVFPEPILCTTPLIATMIQRQRGLRRYWVPASLVAILLLTVGFFVARKTVLPGIGVVAEPVRIVNPTNVVQP